MKVGFIGTGNMGGAILKGYSENARREGIDLLAFNRTKAKAEAIAKDYPLTVTDSIRELVEDSDIVVLAVEPQNFDEVVPEVAKHYEKGKLIVSIAAGKTIAYLEEKLGADVPIIRIMPNTPIMLGFGATVMVRNENVTDEMFGTAKGIFEAGGIVGETGEDMIEAIIGVSGSSPAYTYMYIDALIKSGIKNGLSPEMSKQFAAQAVMGAAAMVMGSSEDPAILCDNVCSPGGATIEAVTKLKAEGFEEMVMDGAQAAVDRAKEMARGMVAGRLAVCRKEAGRGNDF